MTGKHGLREKEDRLDFKYSSFPCESPLALLLYNQPRPVSFGPRVLWVDDEAEFRKFVGVCLEKEGYRVLESTTGGRGLEMAFEEKPDVVLLNVEMRDWTASACAPNCGGCTSPIPFSCSPEKMTWSIASED